MDKKTASIFNFLKANRKFVEQFQAKEFKRYFCHCELARDRLEMLLYNIVHTQSQPRLNELGAFWQSFHAYNWPFRELLLEEVTDFFRSVSTYTPPARGNASCGPWEELFRLVRDTRGWGKKTAALLVKCLIAIHLSHDRSHHFLSDARAFPLAGDKVFLPVDSVIKHIFIRHFSHLNGRRSLDDFDPINAYLITMCVYSPEEMLIWDDLWFWGFFTQNAEGDRQTQWNEAKIWSSPSFPKSGVHVVEDLARQFIELLHADAEQAAGDALPETDSVAT